MAYHIRSESLKPLSSEYIDGLIIVRRMPNRLEDQCKLSISKHNSSAKTDISSIMTITNRDTINLEYQRVAICSNCSLPIITSNSYSTTIMGHSIQQCESCCTLKSIVSIKTGCFKSGSQFIQSEHSNDKCSYLGDIVDNQIRIIKYHEKNIDAWQYTHRAGIRNAIVIPLDPDMQISQSDRKVVVQIATWSVFLHYTINISFDSSVELAHLLVKSDSNWPIIENLNQYYYNNAKGGRYVNSKTTPNHLLGQMIVSKDLRFDLYRNEASYKNRCQLCSFLLPTDSIHFIRPLLTLINKEVFSSRYDILSDSYMIEYRKLMKQVGNHKEYETIVQNHLILRFASTGPSEGLSPLTTDSILIAYRLGLCIQNHILQLRPYHYSIADTYGIEELQHLKSIASSHFAQLIGREMGTIKPNQILLNMFADIESSALFNHGQLLRSKLWTFIDSFIPNIDTDTNLYIPLVTNTMLSDLSNEYYQKLILGIPISMTVKGFAIFYTELIRKWCEMLDESMQITTIEQLTTFTIPSINVCILKITKKTNQYDSNKEYITSVTIMPLECNLDAKVGESEMIRRHTVLVSILERMLPTCYALSKTNIIGLIEYAKKIILQEQWLSKFTKGNKKEELRKYDLIAKHRIPFLWDILVYIKYLKNHKSLNKISQYTPPIIIVKQEVYLDIQKTEHLTTASQSGNKSQKRKVNDTNKNIAIKKVCIEE